MFLCNINDHRFYFCTHVGALFFSFNVIKCAMFNLNEEKNLHVLIVEVFIEAQKFSEFSAAASKRLWLKSRRWNLCIFAWII